MTGWNGCATFADGWRRSSTTIRKRPVSIIAPLKSATPRGSISGTIMSWQASDDALAPYRSGLGGNDKLWRIGTEVYGDRDILPRNANFMTDAICAGLGCFGGPMPRTWR